MGKFLGITFFCLFVSVISAVQAVEIKTPSYVNLSPGADGDGGLNLTRNVSLLSGHSFCYGTIEVTLTNNTSLKMLNVQFIPSILLWKVKDRYGNWHQDKLYYQSESGNSVNYANTIQGRHFVTKFTYIGDSSVEHYDVDNGFAAFWNYPWTTYSAGVDQSDNSKFYGKSVGDLDPNQSATFRVNISTTVDGTLYPYVQWGNIQAPATEFGCDWDEAGILDDFSAPVPEPLTLVLLAISSLGLLLRKK